MDDQTYQEIIGEVGTLITIVSPLLIAIYGAYKAKLHKYIEAKIDTIQDEKLRKVAENALSRVEDLATSTITMLDATEKPKIIEAIKSGTMTKDNLLDLKQTAIETIKKQLTTDGMTDLQNTVGDINLYLNNLVESKLADLKVDNTSSVSKTEIALPTSEEIDNASLRNQLTQVQADKNNLQSQVNQISTDKANVDRANIELTNQINDLTIKNAQLLADKQDIESKYNAINATLSQIVQPQSNVVDNTQATTAQ